MSDVKEITAEGLVELSRREIAEIKNGDTAWNGKTVNRLCVQLLATIDRLAAAEEKLQRVSSAIDFNTPK